MTIEELSKNLERRINKPEWFLQYYDRIFAPLQHKPIRILEIGIDNGGSLELWRKYFTNAEIVGLDIEEKPDIPGTTVFRGDQADVDLLTSLGEFDIVIDDGGHTMKQQQTSFSVLFPNLREKGVYIIEDLETSFLPVYSELRDDRTTLSFLLELAERTCKGNNQYRSIEFLKYLVAIRKS